MLIHNRSKSQGELLAELATKKDSNHSLVQHESGKLCLVIFNKRKGKVWFWVIPSWTTNGSPIGIS